MSILATLEVETGKPLDTSLEDAENEFADKTKEEVIAELVAQRVRENHNYDLFFPILTTTFRNGLRNLPVIPLEQ